MTALSDALAAAQARALAALAKEYVANGDPEKVTTGMLDAMGLTDRVEQAQWFVCLQVMRSSGAQPPSEQAPSRNGAPEPASERQWSLIRNLCDERQMTAPEGPLTKQQAHEVIDSLKQGNYDPNRWEA
jgi:hypothetical protein